jgi:TRAP transporter TAXI family solute receptor
MLDGRCARATLRGNAMFNRVLAAIAVTAAVGLTTSVAVAQKDIRWGSPPVGTAGHKALVSLANLLNKEMPEYRISVLPTAGAITTVKGFATKELDAFYGSDVAYHELATDCCRFKGFKDRVQRMPVQSFWSNTIEVGLAIHVRNKDKIQKWGDLAGKRVFSGPLPFDTRAQSERGLNALGVKFNYVQVDLSTVGSQLESGAIDAMTIYTGSESSPPPWLAEASLAADWAVLNPSPEELAELKKKGFSIAEVSPKAFNRDVHGDKVVELPFYYGFNVGLDVPEADAYKLLTIVEKHAAELAKIDPTFTQIAKDMKGFQVRGVQSSIDLVPIHPGLAKWMREKGVWDSKWDSKIAKM